MSFLSGVGSLVSAVTDPGKIVKDVVDAVLPEELDVVADLAGAAASYYSGRPDAAIAHLAEAARDLPQAFNQADGPSRSGGGAWRDRQSTQFEPQPPPGRGGDTAFSLEKLMSLLQSIIDLVGGKKGAGASAGAGTSDSSSATTGSSGSSSTSTTTKPDDADDAATSGTTSSSSKKTSSSSSKDDTALEKLNKLSDADFMAKIRKGDLPKEITDDPKAMLAINQRVAHIGEMTKLMTQMISALHDMQMSILQNVRA